MGHRLRRLISAATFVRLAVSILLAFVIWGFIVWETNPEETRRFSAIVPTAENVPADMLVVGELPSVTITVKGPQDVVRSLVPSDFRASVDFQEAAGPGIDEYEVEVDAPSGLRKVIVEPDTLDIELDRIVTQTFSVEMREDEPRPPNVTAVTLSTDLVSIQGPKALVDRVETVEVPIDIGIRNESFVDQVAPVPLSGLGERIADIEVSPAMVEVEVTFETTSKDVPVQVVCACVEEGQLQEIVLDDASPIPSTVRVSGTASALENVNVIRTVPVDTAGLERAGWILDVALDLSGLPGSVTLAEQAVDVWVQVAPGRRQVTDVPIDLLNADPEFEVRLSNESVSFVVSGPVDAVEGFDDAGLKAVVDVEGLAPGTYTLDVQVIVPAGLTYEELQPGTVQVTIERASQRGDQINELDDDLLDNIR